MNFVFVSLQRINTERESTSTNLARELARQGHNVLYVNSPVNRKDYFITPESPFVAAHLHAIKSKAAPLQELAPHLWVLYPTQPLDSFNWVPYTPLFLWLIKFNNRRFGHEIQKATRDLGFDEFILVNDKDIFRSFYLKEILRPQRYIYMDRDYTVGAPYWLRHGPSLEPEIMRKADAVVCNSLDFTKRAQHFNPNSFYIGNGFDVSQFNNTHTLDIPEDLERIPGPRIGYVGALITLRLDLNLLIEIARARPAWSFVLIGTEDEAFAQSTLHSLPNVFFLGYKHTRDIPAYLLHFDVCINPQVLNDFTRSNFPLKILEYLALGKPVVATETNTMNEVFADHTYLATGSAEYLVQIDKALEENTAALADERVAYAKQFSWENIAALFIQHLQTL
ncbi:glycosyltransferase [Hymenobacter taeanensis]|uniref:Glycosyltransferase n=1 Tax=Hymenobacter taeanensis TaxID=2735321 RepID=A0A6M6BNJ1_9BACT|nr:MULTISPECIES: glycosyltransferase [Hymenobacter]QJX49053.1 glycosyltransferase [Hymenobacter taeanensis]UOQ81428.1 glycosyltransferase [Hymenobacter sp. 5414T-23]